MTSPDRETLGRLADRQSIEDVLVEYCYRCDLNDPDGLAMLFTEDCEADYGPGVGPPSVGRAARRDEAARDLALFESTSHHLSNVIVEFEGENRARARSVIHAWHRTRAEGPDWNLRAQYHDALVRTADGWKIAARRLVVVDAENFPEEWGFHRLERNP
ncbi:MAG: nuclear transport factor 2 family protein [Solirubrobacterales bacterium]|nr:nuclear transport factor 2 family protein [Solirubrobacterales bacterium]